MGMMMTPGGGSSLPWSVMHVGVYGWSRVHAALSHG
jgi:hypothetical protein